MVVEIKRGVTIAIYFKEQLGLIWRLNMRPKLHGWGLVRLPIFRK